MACEISRCGGRPQFLENLTNATVQLPAPMSRNFLVHHLLDEHMCERVSLSNVLSLLLHQVSPECRIDLLWNVSFGLRAHRNQNVQVPLWPDDARNAEQLLSAGRKMTQPLA